MVRRGLVFAVDDAIAVALHLTSYVSSRRTPGPVFACRPDPVRTVLDQWILAWVQGDAVRFAESLGPVARASLGPIQGTDWMGLRGKLLPRVPANGGVGYRVESGNSMPNDVGADGVSPWFRAMPWNVTFFDRRGRQCAKVRMSLSYRAERALGSLQIENADMISLLGEISRCLQW